MRWAVWWAKLDGCRYRVTGYRTFGGGGWGYRVEKIEDE
jgi:hypothetical protein